MATQTVTITNGATSTFLTNINRRRDSDYYMASIAYAGTFSTAAFVIQYSPDDGTTKINLPDSSGSAPSVTAATVLNVVLGNGGTNSDAGSLYITSSGGGSPSVVVVLQDNT